MMTAKIVSILKGKFDFVQNKIRQKSKRDSKELQNLDNSVSQKLKSLKGLKNEELLRKNDDVKNMISYYNNLTDSIEGRRNKVYDFNIQYFAVLITISSILYTIRNQLGMWYALIIGLLGIQILYSLLIIVTYEMQSKYRYPFLQNEKYGNLHKTEQAAQLKRFKSHSLNGVCRTA